LRQILAARSIIEVAPKPATTLTEQADLVRVAGGKQDAILGGETSQDEVARFEMHQQEIEHGREEALAFGFEDEIVIGQRPQLQGHVPSAHPCSRQRERIARQSERRRPKLSST
jgi:hypothetical protein